MTMKINRDNFEAYFLDYHEGQLSPEMEAEVLRFADLNPDLRPLLEEFEAVRLDDIPAAVFENKSSLKRKEASPVSRITESNCDDYLIRELEGLLSPAEQASLTEFIANNPAFEKNRRLFALTRLSADTDTRFAARAGLKKIAIPAGGIDESNFELFLSRETEGDLSEEEQHHLKEFMRWNPQLERDRKLYSHTLLRPDTAITFANKDALKHSVVPVRRIVFYALSAAASLALLFSVYTYVGSHDPAQPESIALGTQPAATSSTPLPASAKPAAVIPPGAVPAETRTENVHTGNSSAESHDAAVKSAESVRTTESFAMADHHPVAAMEPKIAGQIASRHYVEPEFLFIRGSQMHINENREFYYNLKLAEELQYAALNTKDKTPGRSIVSAAREKFDGLFAQNKPKPAAVTLWTFAELGVQTFNRATFSDLELNIKKDDEGKVVGYGIQGGLIDFNKDFKK
jgi:hypothetical protein